MTPLQVHPPPRLDRDSLLALATTFGPHPFRDGVTAANFPAVAARYLAMSATFPHLQAGAQQRLVLHYMRERAEIPRDVEYTGAVGAFLVWDEMGGWNRTRARGAAALPEILRTDGVHANMLRADLARLLGREVRARYDGATGAYLGRLSDALSSLDPVVRCAAMVAFETHAAAMIEALWGAIGRVFPEVPAPSLEYFATHVGGDDPAEAYHVEMVGRMIELVVPAGDERRFLDAFAEGFRLHVAWCATICGEASS